MSTASQVAVVTGGRGAIGSAIASALSDDGYTVATWDVVPAATGDGMDLVCDVTDENDVAHALAATTSTAGPVSLLVNAAGIAPLDTLFVDMPSGHWERVVHVNLIGPVNVMRAVLPAMQARRSGTIVNICSIWSTQATARYRSAYIASKWGLLGATQAIAAEVIRDGIRVTAVSPGPVDTPMTASVPEDIRSQWLTPNDVAAAVRFAVSDAGRGAVGGELQLFGPGRPDPRL